MGNRERAIIRTSELLFEVPLMLMMMVYGDSVAKHESPIIEVV